MDVRKVKMEQEQWLERAAQTREGPPDEQFRTTILNSPEDTMSAVEKWVFGVA